MNGEFYAPEHVCADPVAVLGAVHGWESTGPRIRSTTHRAAVWLGTRFHIHMSKWVPLTLFLPTGSLILLALTEFSYLTAPMTND